MCIYCNSFLDAIKIIILHTSFFYVSAFQFVNSAVIPSSEFRPKIYALNNEADSSDILYL